MNWRPDAVCPVPARPPEPGMQIQLPQLLGTKLSRIAQAGGFLIIYRNRIRCPCHMKIGPNSVRVIAQAPQQLREILDPCICAEEGARCLRFP